MTYRGYSGYSVASLNLKCCPICGGTSGLTSSIIETRNLNAKWGEKVELKELTETKYGRARCQDCKRYFRSAKDLANSNLVKL